MNYLFAYYGNIIKENSLQFIEFPEMGHLQLLMIAIYKIVAQYHFCLMAACMNHSFFRLKQCIIFSKMLF